MKITVVWFNQDLRFQDNKALKGAENKNVLAIYVLNKNIGSASKIYLEKCLQNLNQKLKNKLNCYKEDVEIVLENIAKNYEIENIFWNQSFENKSEEDKIIKFCNQNKIQFKIFNSNYLFHPLEILKENNDYFKIFTYYKNKVLGKISNLNLSNESDQKINNLNFIKDDKNQTELSNLNLIPQNEWYKKINLQEISEEMAIEKLNYFIKNNLNGYKENRNFLNKQSCSELSKELHFGVISPLTILNKIKKSNANQEANKEDLDHFISELIWREFSAYLLYHFPNLLTENFNPKFNNFPWEDNETLFQAWKTGKTGIPIVDAGMRELWQTGLMHNRARMITASFLTKNLNIHWQKGMHWFEDCLTDADLPNNCASWQWVAGSGADAAPYFRIFSPTLQAEKFDPEGIYIKKFVPELKDLPVKYLFEPWKVNSEILASYNIVLGQNYPKPIVNLEESRKKALERYKLINSTN